MKEQLGKVSQEPLEPLLSDINNQLEKGLAFQEDLINNIQRKLHYILNRDQPEKSEQQPIPSSSDIIGVFRVNLDRLQSHNNLLEKILKHLSEII